MPRQAVAQFGKTADIAARAIGDIAVGIDCGNRAVLAAGGIQPVAHVGQIIVGRRDELAAGGVDQPPAVDLLYHRHIPIEFRNRLIQEFGQVFAG